MKKAPLYPYLALWGLRGLAALLIGILLALQAPPPPPESSPRVEVMLTLGAPQTVETTDRRVCVHTRVTDEVEEVKIQQTFELVREMGAPTIVEYFPWAYVERERGVYDWTHPDRIIRHAENQGLRVLARLGFVPDYLRPDERYTNANFVTDDIMARYALYVGEFAARYAGRVDDIIIWNEPNLNIEWSASGANPVEYTRLLRLAYQAAHEANPNVTVLGGALAPTNEPPRGGGGWNDIDFLNEMYEAGAGAYFDALAAHVYGFTSPPQAEPGFDRLNFRRLELLREVMVRHGDSDKRIYITEAGWNDHPRWVHAVRPGQRIAYTLDAYAYSAENYPWLETLCLWAFRYPAPTNSYPDYFTFVSPTFEPKPIYEALQAYARGWESPQWGD